MALPQTACLALSGPLLVPETEGGRAWFTMFDDFGELIQVRWLPARLYIGQLQVTTCLMLCITVQYSTVQRSVVGCDWSGPSLHSAGAQSCIQVSGASCGCPMRP
jgi:hypothetical protein